MPFNLVVLGGLMSGRMSTSNHKDNYRKSR